ncbi:MAG: glutamyl-tRNA synthetase [uncultured bacterium]|uniref:Glutamate--tRNA ligase n=1 Tax=Candidatus Woesebacteria bacterium RIFCSPLOWO2_01_FULL_39_21 TaxID=1802519 RepID=A0A1F8BFK1_9BACT|nr:MAG: glutamyl-tRNA synthetase [uncultured bacterium]OGM22086.1 MAG: glutamate--tRNA ligase [Candidatus Woesebacteria bacterium RIFCSPHIGHO2_01_FULL_39_23]OGM62088.1 MAG: glutamate--tRNA ligase [Candidatus Woesebacteria bacterium RIFCSPLOWO2_01_FULL_39_21]
MVQIRTRFAPSPTGFLHIGGLRTALYSYAIAKHSNGDFILRVEDTDQKRIVEGATLALQNILKRFGLVWDEFYIQSERQKKGFYKRAADKLVQQGHAFYCQCKPKNAKEEGFSKQLRDSCRNKKFTSGAVKIKVPDNVAVSYFDFVHQKEILWNTNDVYDATLLKSDGFPTYHLAVVVDDLDMKITHILRGHDWLPSTPIHLLIFSYLSNRRPEIGHATDILSGETGKKLSKRRDSVFVEEFLKEGYLPEALLNFVMLLGWAPKDNREIFSLEEFVEAFDIKGFQDANPKFFIEKLDWMNGEYIRKSKVSNLKSQIFDFFEGGYDKDLIGKTLPLVKERIKKLSEFESLAGFFFERPKVDLKLFSGDYKKHLKVALGVLQGLNSFDLESLNRKLMDSIKGNKFKTGDFFMALRIAITGSRFTPPINESILVLGRDEVVKRIKKVLK